MVGNPPIPTVLKLECGYWLDCLNCSRDGVSDFFPTTTRTVLIVVGEVGLAFHGDLSFTVPTTVTVQVFVRLVWHAVLWFATVLCCLVLGTES